MVKSIINIYKMQIFSIKKWIEVHEQGLKMLFKYRVIRELLSL